MGGHQGTLRHCAALYTKHDASRLVHSACLLSHRSTGLLQSVVSAGYTCSVWAAWSCMAAGKVWGRATVAVAHATAQQLHMTSLILNLIRSPCMARLVQRQPQREEEEMQALVGQGQPPQCSTSCLSAPDGVVSMCCLVWPARPTPHGQLPDAHTAASAMALSDVHGCLLMALSDVHGLDLDWLVTGCMQT